MKSRYLALIVIRKPRARTQRDHANNLLKTGGITDKDHLAAQVNFRPPKRR
jgi:hypothetical protein